MTQDQSSPSRRQDMHTGLSDIALHTTDKGFIFDLGGISRKHTTKTVQRRGHTRAADQGQASAPTEPESNLCRHVCRGCCFGSDVPTTN